MGLTTDLACRQGRGGAEKITFRACFLYHSKTFTSHLRASAVNIKASLLSWREASSSNRPYSTIVSLSFTTEDNLKSYFLSASAPLR
jgi:hypothetical protein